MSSPFAEKSYGAKHGKAFICDETKDQKFEVQSMMAHALAASSPDWKVEGPSRGRVERSRQALEGSACDLRYASNRKLTRGEVTHAK